MIIQRNIDYAEIQKRLSTYRVTALLDPRQFQNPQLTLTRCKGLIILLVEFLTIPC